MSKETRGRDSARKVKAISAICVCVCIVPFFYFTGNGRAALGTIFGVLSGLGLLGFIVGRFME